MKHETCATNNGLDLHENGQLGNKNGQSKKYQNGEVEELRDGANALEDRIDSFIRGVMEEARNSKETDYNFWENKITENKKYKQIKSESERIKMVWAEIKKKETETLSDNYEKKQQEMEHQLNEIELETAEVGYHLLDFKAAESEQKRKEGYEKWEQFHGELEKEINDWTQQIELDNQTEYDHGILRGTEYEGEIEIEQKISNIKDCIENVKWDIEKNRTDMETCARRLKECSCPKGMNENELGKGENECEVKMEMKTSDWTHYLKLDNQKDEGHDLLRGYEYEGEVEIEQKILNIQNDLEKVKGDIERNRIDMENCAMRMGEFSGPNGMNENEIRGNANEGEIKMELDIQVGLEQIKKDFKRNRIEMNNYANELERQGILHETIEERVSDIYQKLEPVYEIYLKHQENENEHQKELQTIIDSYCVKSERIANLLDMEQDSPFAKESESLRHDIRSNNLLVLVRNRNVIRHKVNHCGRKIGRKISLWHGQSLGKYLQYFYGPRSIYRLGNKLVTFRTAVLGWKLSSEILSMNDREKYKGVKRQGIKMKKIEMKSKRDRNNKEKCMNIVYTRIKVQGIKFKIKYLIVTIHTAEKSNLMMGKYLQYFTGPRAKNTKNKQLSNEVVKKIRVPTKKKRTKEDCSNERG